MNVDAEHAFREGAAAQYGVVHRDQLVAEGLTPSMIKTKLARHELQPLLPKTYLIGGVPVTWHTKLMAGQLWADDCFISHRSAAALWGLDGVFDELVEICAYSSKRHPEVIVHRLNPEDRPALRYLGPLRVSALERTSLDLCAVAGIDVARRAIEDALRKRLTTLDRLHETRQLDCAAGRDGCRRFGEILDRLGPHSSRLRSRLEQKMLDILLKVEPEGLETDYRVVDGSRSYYLDFAYPNVQVGIETLGFRWHSGSDQLRKDNARHRRLSLLGWTILYFGWDDVESDPDGVMREVHDLLISRRLMSSNRKIR